jgi:pyridoxine 5-phosphate synthase
VLAAFAAAARAAQAAGLGVNAGHDLNLDNLLPFLRALPGVLEVSIGHAFVADMLERGAEEATRAYLRVIEQAGTGAAA